MKGAACGAMVQLCGRCALDDGQCRADRRGAINTPNHRSRDDIEDTFSNVVRSDARFGVSALLLQPSPLTLLSSSLHIIGGSMIPCPRIRKHPSGSDHHFAQQCRHADFPARLLNFRSLLQIPVLTTIYCDASLLYTYKASRSALNSLLPTIAFTTALPTLILSSTNHHDFPHFRHPPTRPPPGSLRPCFCRFR